jgi:hypothetical protein
MASKFIVCNKGSDLGIGCADCGAPIAIEGEREKGTVYICEGCLEGRMERDDADEVEVDIEAPKPADTSGEPVTEADLKKCKEATDPGCGCKVCQRVTPIADAIAAALRNFKTADKAAKVEAIIRVLAEVAVAYQGGGLWHRDATYVGALAQARLSIVADREYMQEIERVRPIIEKAMAEAGIDLHNLVKPLPKESTH